MGLPTGGLIRRRAGGLYAGKKIMASATTAATNTIRQNELHRSKFLRFEDL